MALTAEQLALIEYNEAVEAPRRAYEQQMEQLRAENNLRVAQANAEANLANITRQARIDAIRLAKETLIENRRSQPVDAREVSANDITTFADVLIAYINK